MLKQITACRVTVRVVKGKTGCLLDHVSAERLWLYDRKELFGKIDDDQSWDTSVVHNKAERFTAMYPEVFSDEKSEKIDKASELSLPMVAVPNERPGEVQVIVDSDLQSKTTKCMKYEIPNLEELAHDIAAGISGSEIEMTKIDCDKAFHQLELVEESRDITTMVTTDDLYRYKRPHMKKNCALEIFQHEVLVGSKSVRAMDNEILVWDKLRAEHDRRLHKVRKRHKMITRQMHDNIAKESKKNPLQMAIRKAIRNKRLSMDERKLVGHVNKQIPEMCITEDDINKYSDTSARSKIEQKQFWYSSDQTNELKYWRDVMV